MNKGVNIPKGWREAKLGEVSCNISYGMNAKAINYDKKNKYIRITDIDESSRKFIPNPLYSPDGDIEDKYKLKEGDILFTRTGASVGKTYLYDKRDGNVYFAGFLIRFSIQHQCPKFIYFQTLTVFYQNWVKSVSSRSGQPGINAEEYKQLPILLPPLKEQKAIADILEKWDEAIEKTSKLIEAKKKRFEWLLKNLISKPLNLKNWQKIKLGDLGDISSAGVDKKIIDGEEEVFLLNYLDVYRRDKIYANELSHKVTAPKIKLEKCSIKKGDIFFTPSSEVRGDIGLSAVAMEDIERAVYSYHIIRLRPKIEIDLLYSAYAFKGQDFYKQAAMYADGSGQRYVISQNNFRKIEIFLPPLLQQKQIAKTLNTAKKEITILEEILANYKNQKKGLMQKLLTGKCRLNLGKEATNV